MKIKFSSRPPFVEDFRPDDPRFAGLRLTFRPDARAVSETSWKAAQGKKRNAAGINMLSYQFWRVIKATTGWSGFTVAMLEALNVPASSVSGDEAGDPPPDAEVDYDREALEWLVRFCPPFETAAAAALRRAYGDEDDDEDQADEEQEESDRK